MIKKILILLLLLSSFVYSQNVLTKPKPEITKWILNNGAVDTVEKFTLPFESRLNYGVTTLWFDTVSTSSLGDISLRYYIYNEEMAKNLGSPITGGLVDSLWASYGGLTPTDTVAQIIDVSAISWPFYFPLSVSGHWGKGDKTRIGLKAKDGSAVLNVWVSGD